MWFFDHPMWHRINVRGISHISTSLLIATNHRPIHDVPKSIIAWCAQVELLDLPHLCCFLWGFWYLWWSSWPGAGRAELLVQLFGPSQRRAALSGGAGTSTEGTQAGGHVVAGVRQGFTSKKTHSYGTWINMDKHCPILQIRMFQCSKKTWWFSMAMLNCQYLGMFTKNHWDSWDCQRGTWDASKIEKPKGGFIRQEWNIWNTHGNGTSPASIVRYFGVSTRVRWWAGLQLSGEAPASTCFLESWEEPGKKRSEARRNLLSFFPDVSWCF